MSPGDVISPVPGLITGGTTRRRHPGPAPHRPGPRRDRVRRRLARRRRSPRHVTCPGREQL